ncbi:MAG: hypothetical protein ACYTFI_03455 [Planctomycetota bacterium]
MLSGRVNPRDLRGRELKKAFNGFVAYLRLNRDLQAKLAIVKKGIERFSGTRYEADFRGMAVNLRTALAAVELKRLTADRSWRRLSTAQRIQHLERIKPKFAGTKYADSIDKTIQRAKRAEEKRGSR